MQKETKLNYFALYAQKTAKLLGGIKKDQTEFNRIIKLNHRVICRNNSKKNLIYPKDINFCLH